MDYDEPQLLSVDEPAPVAHEPRVRWRISLAALIAANVVGVVLLVALRF